jgi:hypothetical protein
LKRFSENEMSCLIVGESSTTRNVVFSINWSSDPGYRERRRRPASYVVVSRSRKL